MYLLVLTPGESQEWEQHSQAVTPDWCLATNKIPTTLSEYEYQAAVEDQSRSFKYNCKGREDIARVIPGNIPLFRAGSVSMFSHVCPGLARDRAHWATSLNLDKPSPAYLIF